MTLSTPHFPARQFTPRTGGTTRRSATVLASVFVLAGALSAAACGGASSAGSGQPQGSGADAGQGGSGERSAGGSSGTKATSGGSTSSSGGSTAEAGSGASDASGGSVSGGGDTSSGGSSAAAGSATAGSAGSTTTTTQCNDGIDNDGDGLIDGLDPECTGPWDNDEGSFATGVPGDNKDPKWQDCFFDGNSGAGDDGCRYGTDCLYGATPQQDPTCTVTQQCVDYCGALTPNGCDCFGCCTVQKSDGSSVDIFEVSTCSIANIDDATACPRCTKNTQCQNTCGECELCPGKTAADLPASCTPTTTGSGGTSGTGGSSDTGGTSGGGGSSATGGTSSGGSDGNPPPPPSYTCDGGAQVCGPGLAACPSGFYCSLGCCLVVVR